MHCLTVGPYSLPHQSSGFAGQGTDLPEEGGTAIVHRFPWNRPVDEGRGEL